MYKCRFQIYPIWRFFKGGTCMLCVAGKPKQKENVSVLLWMRPWSSLKSLIALQYPQCCITMGVKGLMMGICQA